MNNSISKLIGKVNEKKHSVKRTAAENTNSSVNNVLNDKTPFSITEAYKTARTNILFSLADVDGCKKIIFTSAEPGEGKTTSILNTAITFSQTGAKVLVIDGDMRKPRIHRYLEIEKTNGLSDLLIGLIDDKTAIHHCEKKGIDCIPAGQIPPNPVELLSSDKMKNLLDRVSENYDYIFIDTPPVTVVTDAASMASFVDGYVLIVRHNYTIHELLEKEREALIFAEAKILGYMVNDIKPMGGIGYGKYGAYGNRYRYKYRYRYGYKYGYKYGYGYGYGYQYGDRRNNAYSDEYVYGDKEDKN